MGKISPNEPYRGEIGGKIGFVEDLAYFKPVNPVETGKSRF